MKISWMDVVGMKRVAAVDRYVSDELVVWIPRPRRTSSDSSAAISLAQGRQPDIPVYPRLVSIHSKIRAAGTRYRAGSEPAKLAAAVPGTEELIHGGMLTNVAHLYQTSSRISHAVRNRKTSSAWCRIRAPGPWGDLVDTVKETVVGDGRRVRSTHDVDISSLLEIQSASSH
jgi:hypothetical protein